MTKGEAMQWVLNLTVNSLRDYSEARVRKKGFSEGDCKKILEALGRLADKLEAKIIKPAEHSATSVADAPAENQPAELAGQTMETTK
jgi:hypothetical protein